MLINSGSFLPALQEVSSLRADQPEDLTASDVQDLESRALDALSKAFTDDVSNKKFVNALTLFDSATTYGKPDVISGWTRESLYDAAISQYEASGDMLVSLLTRLRALDAGEPTEAQLTEDLAFAEKLGDTPAAQDIFDRMGKLGYQAASPETGGNVDFQRAIDGTATIWVNRGIKMENGVGYPDRVIGSGFFIDSRGYLLTNYHVIKSEVDPTYEGYSRLYVRLTGETGDRIPAKVVGYDTVFDLALIQVETKPPSVFTALSARNATPGEKVFAIGSPVGLEKTVTAGIVSATGRRFLQVGDTLQVDVPLNPGNSGGPLLDEAGSVIGVVFAGLEQYQGINFAIPYARIQAVLPELYAGGAVTHPWLGLALAETDSGLEVIYAVPDEPAAKAGIAVGDIVEQIDGVPCTTVEAAQDAILNHAAPSLVRLRLRRGDQSFERILCLSNRPDSPVELALKRDTVDAVVYPLFGMELEKTGTVLWKSNYISERCRGRLGCGRIGLLRGRPPHDPGLARGQGQGLHDA